MARFRRTALALTAAILAVCCLSVPTASATSPSDTLGVYTGGGNVNGANNFGNWLGRPVSRAMDFIDGSTWASIEDPNWVSSMWRGEGFQMDLSIPMFPSSGGSLASGASGGYNSHFTQTAQRLVANGQADATLRIGWEFNGTWFRWSAANDPASYAAYFRQIVSTMRAVSGQHFKFEWNPALGKVAVAPDQAYPGDAYVDYIALDFYDNSWIANHQDPVARWDSYLNQPYGLKWHRDFAAAHGKPMTYPEWGLMIRPDGHGGGDNPYFIDQMYSWIQQNNVAAHHYFEFDAPDGQHELMGTQFTQSAARFKQLFGPATTTPPPPPTPTPPPEPTPPPPTTTTPTTTSCRKTSRRSCGKRTSRKARSARSRRA